MRDPILDPAVRRQLAMAHYAKGHSNAQTAGHFGFCWGKIQAAVKRVELYQQTGNIEVLQNKARGKSGWVAP